MRYHGRPRAQRVARSAFAGFRFPPEAVVLAVRWYLRFGLSYRDVEELLAERGIDVEHVTIYRWVQRFTPLLVDAARPCRHAIGDRWRVDETHVKVAGQWRYVYRAIDQYGQVIDVFVSARRDTAAARRFFTTALRDHGTPTQVITDRARALRAAIEDLIPTAIHDHSRGPVALQAAHRLNALLGPTQQCPWRTPRVASRPRVHHPETMTTRDALCRRRQRAMARLGEPSGSPVSALRLGLQWVRATPPFLRRVASAAASATTRA